MNQHKPHHRTGANKHQPPPNQHRPHTPSQRNITGDVPKTKPSIHPVKYRLGETEEQRVSYSFLFDLPCSLSGLDISPFFKYFFITSFLNALY